MDYEFREEFEERYKEWAARTTVSEILARVFGSDFSGATQEQRLLLLETVALSLRKSGSAWQHNLNSVCSRAGMHRMPRDCFPCIEIERNEGLKLLAILNVAIVEGYSVLAASERLS
jgi:hypothetical protein